MAAKGMRKTRLKDVCERITVGHVGPMADKYIADGVPFLRSQNITPFRLNLDDIKFVPSDFHEKLHKSALRPGDVAVVRTGYPGTACVIPDTFDELNCADLVVITPTKELNPYYLAAIFNSAWGMASVAGNLVGVAQQHFNIGAARELEVLLPPRTAQDRIAGILSAYDELMENSQRRIRILEAMARSLYRKWFIQFRFPGHEKLPRVASPLGEIPQGWDVKLLNDVVHDIVDYRGKTPAKLNGEWSDEGILALSALNVKGGRLVNLDKSRYVSEDLYSRWMKNPLRRGDILMTSEAPLGELFFLCEERQYCLSQRLFSIRANPHVIAPVILYLCMESEQTQHELRSRASGSTVSGIRQSELRNVPIVVPPRPIQERARPVLLKLAELKAILDNSLDNLRRTRDLLLPRLMNGEIQ